MASPTDAERHRRSGPTTSAVCCARPQLLEARDDRATGRITAEELRAVEDDAIRDVVGCSATSGCGPPPTASSGARRGTWTSSTSSAASAASDGRIQVKFHNAEGDIEFTAAALQVDAPVRLPKTIFGDDFAFLRSTVDPGVTAKLTIPSPSMVHYRGGRAAIDPAVYPDEEQFWADLSAAYAAQVRGVAELGCTLPAARRHQPGLPQRPGAAGRARPRAATTPSTSTCATSGRSTRRSRTGRPG